MKEKNQDLYNVSEVQLIFKNRVKRKKRPHIRTSTEAHAILRTAWDDNRIGLLEEFKILMLNRSGHCLGVSNISVGGVSGCVVDPKIVFATALKANASSIILAHNHPSGNPKPSEHDIRLTNKLVEGGRHLDISVIEHIIMTPTHYYSMGDDGLMPNWH